MSKALARSTLYRLIEAGQRTHGALLAPLLDRALEPGDDALLLAIDNRRGLAVVKLAKRTGLDEGALEPRIDRLMLRDLLRRHAVGPKLMAGVALTERGERIRAVLDGHWRELENALLGELSAKDRKRLSRILRRFVQLLRL